MRIGIILLFACWLYAVGLGTVSVRAGDRSFADNNSAEQTETANGTDTAPQKAQSASPERKQNSASRIFWRWFRMGERVQGGQPNWLSPLATTSGRLKQEFRYDVWKQSTGGGSDYNFGGGKGLEFIVAPRVQLLAGVPPYIAHMGAANSDGYGDIPLMAKVRLVSAPAGEGDYLLTVLVGATVPAGSNSMRDAVISPAIAFGKGWRSFDVQTTFGENLPTGDTTALGRQLVSNTAFQYRARWQLWPELEVNSAFFLNGKNSGEAQVFLTPGVGFGRIQLWRAFRFSAAAGLQIAATQFHTYNHRAIFSMRYSF